MEYEFIYEKVLKLLKTSTGMTANEIAAVIVDEDPQSVKSTIAALKKRGCIETIGTKPRLKGARGRDHTIFAATDVPYEKTMTPYVPETISRKEIKKTFSEVDRLRSRIAELEHWRNEALRRFPDLAIDEELLEARKRAADAVRSKGREDHAILIEKGERDHIPLVQEMIKILRTVQ